MTRQYADPDVAFLHSIPIFQSLPMGEIVKFGARFLPYRLKKGEFLFFEGDAPQYFIIIQEGLIKAVKYSEYGKDTIINLFGPKMILGAVSSFDGNPYPATTQAISAAKILRVERETFLHFVKNTPELLESVINELCFRLRNAYSALRFMASEQAENRLAHIVLRLYRQFGDLEKGILKLPLIRQDFADLVGCTLETAIRIFSKWQKQGIIHSQKGRIHLINLAYLESLTGA